MAIIAEEQKYIIEAHCLIIHGYNPPLVICQSVLSILHQHVMQKKTNLSGSSIGIHIASQSSWTQWKTATDGGFSVSFTRHKAWCMIEDSPSRFGLNILLSEKVSWAFLQHFIALILIMLLFLWIYIYGTKEWTASTSPFSKLAS